MADENINEDELMDLLNEGAPKRKPSHPKASAKKPAASPQPQQVTIRETNSKQLDQTNDLLRANNELLGSMNERLEKIRREARGIGCFVLVIVLLLLFGFSITIIVR